MLIEEREALESYNLKFNFDKKISELPFDPNTEFADFNFMDSVFLGRIKTCFQKSTNTAVELKKAVELNSKLSLSREFSIDFSNDIILLIRQTLLHGIVFFSSSS